MRDLLNGIYNKVLSFFSTAKDEEETASKETAYNRLKLVLMHDRAGLSEGTLQMMRSELIEVISKYMEIDTDALDLKLETEGESIALMLGIPVIRAKSEEEIQEAIESQKEDSASNTHEEDDNAAEIENDGEASDSEEEASAGTKTSAANEDSADKNETFTENEKNEQSNADGDSQMNNFPQEEDAAVKDAKEKTAKQPSSKKSKKKTK